MGTLTANTTRLPEFCAHKLPSSCRLTSIPNCCACADERAHSASYSTYIDGIGFVPRGTRWQRYCWFCKEFWENRVATTDLRPAQTRIPEVPDQTEFLSRWYEFHRGYRIVTREDGTEDKIAVLGEPFRDVSPGQLPRTLDELRAGQERSAADQVRHVAVHESETVVGPSLDDTLEQMFATAMAEEAPAESLTSEQSAPPQPTTVQLSQPLSSGPLAGQTMQPLGSRHREYQSRRIAALRRELHRMRSGIERVISGLRELGENVPDSTEATGRLTELGRTLDVISGEDASALLAYSSHDQRLHQTTTVRSSPSRGIHGLQHRQEEANARLAEAIRFRDRSAAELASADTLLSDAQQSREDAVETLEQAEIEIRERRQQVDRLHRERRTAENYLRIFGSREEMEQQGADYESPIGGLFNRAWDRFRVAEEVRREERTLRQVLDDEQNTYATAHAHTTLHETTPHEGQGDTPVAADTRQEDQLNEYYAMLRRQDWAQQTSSYTNDGRFPSNMLDAVRQLDAEERAARLAYVRSLIHGAPPRGQPQQQEALAELLPETPREPQRQNVLDRLLQHTAAPEREAIIQRMTENGTAQALQDIPADRLGVWRRIHEHQTLSDNASSDTASQTWPEDELQGLDIGDDGRPEPREDEQMTMKLDCKVCYTQLADTACLPCGHLVMCQWCSEQHSPVMDHDRTRPRMPANCPVCRKRIKQKVRIFRP